MICIVAYDIEDNRIRNRLARYLEGKGIRLQKSVFAIEIERHTFRGLLRQIGKITGKTSKVAVFRLCIDCRNNAVHLADNEKKFYIF